MPLTRVRSHECSMSAKQTPHNTKLSTGGTEIIVYPKEKEPPDD